LANLGFHSVPHGVQRRGGDKFHSFLEITVRSNNGSQQVLNKRRGVILAFVPAVLRGLQCIVIALLRPGNLGFE
ncbi:MAG: hypothetical protein J5772_06025, partial [Clostridia bacterium]|nr:hypothetical protein [Clostridia bacterium]